ncbi:MAG: SAM-dependent methyltransferase [Thermoprotei archaeon]|nr:MAG: SAM-dependent methyltransferase [Thermoprotei archaeon]
MANVREGDIFYDLGCGDGRVVIEAAKRGAQAICIEINPTLIKRAKENVEREGVANRVKIINASFFDVSIRDATVVYMYLLTSVNKALRPKLETELAPGTRVISLDFEIPGWIPVRMVSLVTATRIGTLYLYIVGNWK